MAKHAAASFQLFDQVREALGLGEFPTRRIVLDLEYDSAIGAFVTGFGTEDLLSIEWASEFEGVEPIKLAEAERPAPVALGAGLAGADLGRIEIRSGDLVVILWPGELSEKASARISAGLESAIYDRLGEMVSTVVIITGADRFGVVALHGRPAEETDPA